MRILYIVISSSLPGTAVTEKVRNQVESFNRCGAETVGLLFTRMCAEESLYTERLRLLPLPTSKRKLFNDIFQEILEHRQVFKYLKQFVKHDDVLFIRYSSSNYYLYKLAKRFENRIVFEFQSKDIDTLKFNRLRSTDSSIISTILTTFNSYVYPKLNDMIFGSKIRNKAKALVGVTNEICMYQVEKYGFRGKTALLTNSVNTKDFRVREFQPQEKYTLLFLRGAGTAAVYHGLDRLIEGLRISDQIRDKIFVICIGNNFEVEKEMVSRFGLSENFTFKDFMDKNQLDQYFNISDLGVGTLALHRIKLKEGTVLKVREYFARGLPFIYGYNDTDIDNNPALSKYCLQVAADDTPIDICSLVDFMKKGRLNKDAASEMNFLAEQYLAFDVKTKNFLKQLHVNHHA